MAGEQSRLWGKAASVLPVLPPRFALIELALFALVIVAEWMIPSFPDLTRMNPHPFWIPVLLLSLQYGTVSGMMAAALAIGGSVLLGLPEPEIGESYFNYLIRAWTQPVLWLIVGLLLGGFRMRQIEQRDGLLRGIRELQGRASALVEYSNNLKTRCERLERRLAMRTKPETDRLLEALSLAQSGAPGRWAQGFETAVDLVLPRGQASLFVTEGEGMRMVVCRGWPDGVRWRTEVAAGEPLAQAILGEARGLSVLEAADEAALAGEGLFAVPVIAPDTGIVIGMLKVEAMAPRQIEPATLKRLAVLAAHLAPPLQRRTLDLVVQPDGDRRGVAAAGGDGVRRWRPLKWLRGGREVAELVDEGTGEAAPPPRAKR